MGFWGSCTNVHLNGTTLVVDAKDMNGSKKYSSVNLNDCIANDDGHLHWRHGGGFGGSSENIRLDGTVLHADCRLRNGSLFHSQIDLNGKIANMDGRLCVHI